MAPKHVFGSMSPQGRPTDLMGLARQQYPRIFDNLNMGFVNSPTANSDGNMLESWPAGEPGAPDYPRPSQLPLDQFGVQVFDQNTTPRDLAADVVSHQLVKTDPAFSGDYQAFAKTFDTPQGQDRLRQDYSYSRQNEGERRPMNEWASTDRIPAYMRAYVFSQWPNAEKAFSPEQLAILDRIKATVNQPRGKAK
ncbi:hypothetical protein [Mesorhizobium sp. URHB0026]